MRFGYLRRLKHYQPHTKRTTWWFVFTPTGEMWFPYGFRVKQLALSSCRTAGVHLLPEGITPEHYHALKDFARSRTAWKAELQAVTRGEHVSGLLREACQTLGPNGLRDWRF